ncbi:intermembrane transport protein PqiB [Acidocella sp.]|uniref:PqiB family protein n=1 Tax=Acidocella sp. TaxID=50710 RepID=UPI00261F79CE|nr:MlaD family protein [Acidocella sp.]
MSASQMPPAPPPAPPKAVIRRPRFQLVWLIPLIAAAIAGYLGYRTIIEQGPLLTLTFTTADGLEAGQTQVKYKAVALGTVESIGLSRDNSHVIVKVRMNATGARFLTSHARFWVERPRLNLADTSGIETIVSGPYIAVDPGPPGGQYQRDFAGLEQPPGVRSDEPGHTYILTAQSVGSLNSGSPIYFRDVQAGEVLGYDIGNGLGPVKINVFIRAPFDDLVRPDTRFYNTSGISLGVQGGVLHLELQSVAALVAGGITFSLPDSAASEPPSATNSTFPLYPSAEAAQAASYHTQVPIITYLTGDVSGLTPGAPVVIGGIQVGDVTAVALQIDPGAGVVRVRVAMDVQPERVLPAAHMRAPSQIDTDLATLVAKGLRAELASENLVTGQKEISLVLAPNAAKAGTSTEDGALVIPSQPAGLDQVIANAADISAKLDRLPYQQIGDNLNRLLATSNATLGGKPMRQTIQNLAATLASANQTLTTLNNSFGQDSDFQHQLNDILRQTSAALIAVQALSDQLNNNPQAFLFGRRSP